MEDNANEKQELTPKDKLKLTSPEILASTDPPLVKIAHDGGIVCPFCGNGSGKDGTGVKPDLTEEGYRYYCHKCHKNHSGKPFDNIDIAAQALRLPTEGDENRANFKKVIDKALELINSRPANAQVHRVAPNPNQQAAITLKPIEPSQPKNYAKFYHFANDNLNKLFKERELKTWRGLTLETLNRYYCGYTPNWGKYETPRIIIPSSINHYLARFDDQFHPIDDEKKKLVETKVISEKQHYGTKTIFGMLKTFVKKHTPEWETLHGKDGYTCRHLPNDGYDEPVFIVEGEIDAMTGYQVSGYDFLAISGSVISKDMAEELIFNGKNFKTKPATFIVLMDNDDTGRAAAPAIADKLIALGHTAIIADWQAMGVAERLFYKPGKGECKDLNECLTSGFEENLKIFLSFCAEYASFIHIALDEHKYEICEDEEDFKRGVDKLNRYFWNFFCREVCQKNPLIPNCSKRCADCMICRFKPPTLPLNLKTVKGVNVPLLQTPTPETKKPTTDDTPKTDTPPNEAPPQKKQTSKEAIPSCPIDLKIPDGMVLTDKGIRINGTGLEGYFCKTPLVITKSLYEVDTGFESMELAVFNKALQQWRHFVVDNQLIYDHRKIVDIAKYGVKFEQKHAAKMTSYLADLAMWRGNDEIIPYENLHNRPGWIDKKLTQFIYPERTISGHTLSDPTNFYADKFSKNGNCDEWRKEIYTMFTHFDTLPVFNVILGAALSAPLLKIVGVRNLQFLLWCSTGKGKSALVKSAMSIYGNPEKLKNTFNSTANALDGLMGSYNDLPCWIDEYQSAKPDVKAAINQVIYNFAEGKTRGRQSQKGAQRPTFKVQGVRIMTAEQPILSESADAGEYNRLLQISSSELFPKNFDIPHVHRFFNANYGHFGYEWIQYLANPDNRPLIMELFQKAQADFTAAAKGYHWSNGWADAFATNLTALQLALPLIDPYESLTAEKVKEIYFKNFKVINYDIPKQTTYENYQRAILALEDFIASHIRYFEREFSFRESNTRGMQEATGSEVHGYFFMDKSIGFIPTNFRKILEGELGFSSAKSILRDFHEHGLIKCPEPVHVKGYAYRKKFPDGTVRRLIYFKPNTLQVEMEENQE